MVPVILWFLGSAVLVDLIGYWLHRAAHRPWSGAMHRAHMTHHVRNYPPREVTSDRYRSSRAASLAIWLAPFFVIYSVAAFAVGVPHPWAVVAGAGLTAAASSVIHDLTHVSGSIAWRWPMLLGPAVRHHAHHFKMGRNFGIVVTWWDDLFRTRVRRSVASRAKPPDHDLSGPG